MSARPADDVRGVLPATRPDSTLADVQGVAAARRGRPLRRAVVALMCVVVLLGAVGVFGVRARTLHASSAGYQLTLTYPLIARAGLDVPWHVSVRHDGGFGGEKQVTLAVTAAYFDIFETQGFHPEPDTETRDGDLLYLSFTPPPRGDVFEVDFDTYVQPSSQLGRRADLWVLQRGHRAVGLAFATWLVP